MMNILAIAIAPSIILLIYIYSRDKYDREPLSMLLKLFLLGGLYCIPAYFIESFLSAVGNPRSIFYTAFVVAAFTEETGKFIILKKWAYNNPNFNERIDGIVYAVFTSLGFATIENILYVSGYGFTTGIVRAFLAVPGHMLFGITMGYYLSIYRFMEYCGKYRPIKFRALFFPILLHGIYDYIAMSGSYGYFYILALFMVILWKTSIKKLRTYEEESKRQWLIKKNWLPPV